MNSKCGQSTKILKLSLLLPLPYESHRVMNRPRMANAQIPKLIQSQWDNTMRGNVIDTSVEGVLGATARGDEGVRWGARFHCAHGALQHAGPAGAAESSLNY